MSDRIDSLKELLRVSTSCKLRIPKFVLENRCRFEVNEAICQISSDQELEVSRRYVDDETIELTVELVKNIEQDVEE